MSCGEIELAGGLLNQAIAVSPRVSSCDRLALLEAVVGSRIGEEALPGLLAEATLRDQAAQDQRRLEVVPVLGLRALERRQDFVEPGGIGPRERRRDDAEPGHHRQVDVADRRDSLLEHEAGLDERLQAEPLHQGLGVDVSLPWS